MRSEKRGGSREYAGCAGLCRERVGLTNDELQKCHYHVAIAANPEYSSLNFGDGGTGDRLRSAYGTAGNAGKRQAAEHEETPYPLVDDTERFYGHLEQTLLSTGFIREGHPGQVMNKLRRLFTRARPESRGTEHPARHSCFY